MHSLCEMFRIGRGPSSSHTMGPERAAKYVLQKYPEADLFIVTLYGSLAKTGRGHRTDYAIEQTLGEERTKILWNTGETRLPHPNTMDFEAFCQSRPIGQERILSIGGGAIQVEGMASPVSGDVYQEKTLSQIIALCKEKQWTLPEYIEQNEGRGVWDHLEKVWAQMKSTIETGLQKEGELPGGLHVMRRAKDLLNFGHRDRNLTKKEHYLICAYSYACCEENASGGMMVTAPTCGACGVLPAVLYYETQLYGISDREILQALAVAGLIACIIRENASVSGAECGCQAEVGSACSMAAAALAYLHGLDLDQIECAAEIAMEHCLGLTCDPIGGLVQIPCIERNATGALRAYDAATLAEVISGNRKISFDLVIRTMYETGKDLSACYRETADGGLAKLYVKDFY